MPYSLESLHIGSVLQLRESLDTREFYIPKHSFVEIINISLRQSRRYPFKIGRFYQFKLVETLPDFQDKRGESSDGEVAFIWRESTLAARFYYFRTRNNE